MSRARTEAACLKASEHEARASVLRNAAIWHASRERSAAEYAEAMASNEARYAAIMGRYATSDAARVATAQAETRMQAAVDEMWAERAAGRATELYDPRKGTIRGFAALILVFLLLPIIGALL